MPLSSRSLPLFIVPPRGPATRQPTILDASGSRGNPAEVVRAVRSCVVRDLGGPGVGRPNPPTGPRTTTPSTQDTPSVTREPPATTAGGAAPGPNTGSVAHDRKVERLSCRGVHL